MKNLPDKFLLCDVKKSYKIIDFENQMCYNKSTKEVVMKKYLMQCGHVAQATDENGKPVCVICLGIDPKATEVAEELPDLAGRKARCPYCRKTRDSSFDLPFFEYKKDSEEDQFYDGCFGWD